VHRGERGDAAGRSRDPFADAAPGGDRWLVLAADWRLNRTTPAR
jgi:hypothetical protein